ncbi:MAG: laminin B domain-containing protein [Armatimonadota bacterium]
MKTVYQRVTNCACAFATIAFCLSVWLLSSSGLAIPLLAPDPGDGIAASSTFDSGVDGWQIIDLPDNGPYDHSYGLYDVSYDPSSGNPGGCITGTDPSSNTFFFKAPDSFLGDQSGIYGGELIYDMISIGGDYFDVADVVLIGAGLTITYDVVGNPGTTWKAMIAPMTETGWKLGNLSGAAVTEQQFREVLAQLTGLHIRGEYRWGAETGYLDNVYLSKFASTSSIDLTVDPGVNYIGDLSGISLDYILSGPMNYSGTVTLNSSGTAVIPSIQPGTYSLVLNSTHWLRRAIQDIVLSGNAPVNTSITNGDSDGDGMINLFDFVVLDSTFGTNNPMADLDGSGLVNLFDYVIIDSNFGAQAD